MSTQTIGLGLGGLNAGCRRHRGPTYERGAAPPSVPSLDAGSPEAAGDVLPDSFAALYPVFLLRWVNPVQKAQIWSRYQGRWVRWTGELRSRTRDGFAVRMLPGTVTFDVSVTVETAERPLLDRYRIGESISFTGRLGSYDDVFKTFYLTHGQLTAVPPAPSVRSAAEAPASSVRDAAP